MAALVSGSVEKEAMATAGKAAQFAILAKPSCWAMPSARDADAVGVFQHLVDGYVLGAMERLLQDERDIYCTDSARTLDRVANGPDTGYNGNVPMFHGRKCPIACMYPPLEPPFKQRLSAGFTLVEIAIVLVIIGLIVGGIMVGADLIKAATLRSQISQLNRYTAAMATFQTKYNSLPGDMPPDLAAQNGFVSRAGTQGHGDGNGVIEGGNSSSGSYWGWNLSQGEAALFWDDLTFAGMIDQAFTTPELNNLSPQSVCPRGKISGTYLAVWISCSSGAGCLGPGTPGITYLALCAVHPTRTTCNPGLTVSQAAEIDAKLDDGTPIGGAVFAFSPVTWTGNSPDWAAYAGTDSSSTCFNNSTNAYSTNVNGGAALNCNVFFKFR